MCNFGAVPWHMAFQCSSYLQHSIPYFILIRHWTLPQLIVSLFNSIVSFHQHNLFEEVLRHQSKQTQHNRVCCFHLIMLVQYTFHMDKYLIVFTSFHIFSSTTSEWASCMDEFETIPKAVFLCPNTLANHLSDTHPGTSPQKVVWDWDSFSKMKWQINPA